MHANLLQNFSYFFLKFSFQKSIILERYQILNIWYLSTRNTDRRSQLMIKNDNITYGIS